MRLDSGELEGRQPRDTHDRAHYALRLAEFESTVEDYKHFGGQDDWGVHHRWADFSEEQKLDKIVREAGSLHLYFEPRKYEIIDREVDLARVPEGRRRGIESNRERLRIGPEEYERREQAKYAPPNEAAAAFKERIEEGLWKTCFTDGEMIFADWSDLTAEAKLHELAKVMDWERVPESYFRTMVERELKVEERPAQKREALEKPSDNRHVFAAGFEDGIDAPPGHNGDQARPSQMSGEIRWDAERREAKARELFDTANRVQFAEFLEKKALDPDIALQPASRVREVYFQQAEKTWDSVREECEFRSDAEIQETLELFKAKEAQLGDREPKLHHWLPAGSVALAGDDTVDEHRGAHVYGKGRHRDPVRSTHSYTAYRWGHKWVVLAILVLFPFANRLWALPVLVALYRSREWNQQHRRRHRTPAQLLRRLVAVLLHRFPHRHFTLSGDGGYGSPEMARFVHRHRRRLRLLSRYVPDAQMYTPPPVIASKRPAHRPRTKGEKLLTPEATVAATGPADRKACNVSL